MKKYLINEDQLRNIKTVFVLYGLGAPFEDLKPIEPLGETDVFYNDKIMSHNYMPMSVVMELVRAIEAHILGETREPSPWVLAELADNGGQP